jgi:hypothetical protein
MGMAKSFKEMTSSSKDTLMIIDALNLAFRYKHTVEAVPLIEKTYYPLIRVIVKKSTISKLRQKLKTLSYLCKTIRIL